MTYLQFEFDALIGCCAEGHVQRPTARQGDWTQGEEEEGMGKLALAHTASAHYMHAGPPPQKDG